VRRGEGRSVVGTMYWIKVAKGAKVTKGAKAANVAKAAEADRPHLASPSSGEEPQRGVRSLFDLSSISSLSSIFKTDLRHRLHRTEVDYTDYGRGTATGDSKLNRTFVHLGSLPFRP
jgi:hypothetical protein